jgi:PAS domain S-box-containing protein
MDEKIKSFNQRKKAEIAHDSEEFFRLIFDQSPIGSLIVSLDYTPLQVNEVFSRMLGYSKEELMSMKFPGYTYPEDLDSDLKQRKLLISGAIDNFVMEKRYIHKNGEIVWINLYVSGVKDESNTLVSLLVMVKDITKRKQMEKLVNQSTDKLVNINKKLNIEIDDCEKAEIKLENINKILNVEIDDYEKAEIKLENINKILNVEIDDYEKAEIKLENLIDELKISNIELEQFAYISSHDLKEPLRMITSFLQLLQKKYADTLDDDANEFINFAVDGAKRLDLLINDLLEFSRIGSQERELNYLNSEKILELVLINLKPLIQNNNVKITHDPLPSIYANDQQIVQLFQNLISNAIKYRSEENPEIHISSNKLDNEYVFSVKDNGIGIDKKHLEQIFTIFQRLHTQGKYAGTGIGLAISEKIVQQHHGKIWAESELGKGTTFYFTLSDRNY